MARNIIELLNQYDLVRKKIVAYVKDEGANLNAMKITLKFVGVCEVWYGRKFPRHLLWSCIF